jgi:cytoskeletal protein CcmA (bactofilin family)
VEGSIEAGERLEVRDTAVVEGDLSAPRLLVADGADLRATVDMPVRGSRKPELVGVA